MIRTVHRAKNRKSARSIAIGSSMCFSLRFTRLPHKNMNISMEIKKKNRMPTRCYLVNKQILIKITRTFINPAIVRINAKHTETRFTNYSVFFFFFSFVVIDMHVFI